MKHSSNYGKIFGACLLTFIVIGCSIYRGYYALPVEERELYQSVAHQMSVQQRMEYLNTHDSSERMAYLEALGLPTSLQQEHTETAKVTALKEEVVETSPSVEFEEKNLQEEQNLLIHEREALARKQRQDSVSPQMRDETVMIEKSEQMDWPMGTEVIELKQQAKVNPEPKPQVPPKISYPRVRYKQSGDPVIDILTLLELYQEGKISKEQFEQEKELAFQAALN